MKKKIFVWIAGTLVILLFIRHLYDDKNWNESRIEEIYPIAFSGKVIGVGQRRGLEVEFENLPKIYILSGFCNDSICLSQRLEIGDSLFKEANSNILIHKSARLKQTFIWHFSRE